MKNSNALNEQQLDDISGGPAFVKMGDFKARGIIVPDYKVSLTSSNPTPHPAPAFRNSRGVINPDSMKGI
ncbi:MAG: hypothetical protein GY905_01345 [Gammaproteobacteria bacterium]|nr:hypothetical protein [Gammaproteobacteria bacterium]